MHAVLRTLHPTPRRKVWAAIDALREDPHIGGALSRELDGLWRLPVSRIRIVYRFDSRSLEVVRIGRRETIYEDLAARRRQERGTELPLEQVRA